jgi:radical SAM superfamily enzyme YgiQ (UPF0313 family)
VISLAGKTVALVQPPFDIPSQCGGRYYTSIPLGLAQLAALLEEEGFVVRAFDANIGVCSPCELAERIALCDPWIVGFQVSSPALRYVRECINHLREGGVTSSIVVGGAHVGADPESSRTLEADAYFTGYADISFPKYCTQAVEKVRDTIAGINQKQPSVQALEKACDSTIGGLNLKSSRIQALVNQRLEDIVYDANVRISEPWRKDYGVKGQYGRYDSGQSGDSVDFECGQAGGEGAWIMGVNPDLDLLPIPDRGVFDIGVYGYVGVCASRGCPYNCAYCGMARSGYRKRGVASIVKELMQLRDDGFRRVDFTDDVFTHDRGFALDVGRELGELGFEWAMTTRADLLDEDLIGELRGCGLSHVSIGVESADEKVRCQAGKNIRDESYLSAFKALREHGVGTTAYFMVGLPGETREGIMLMGDYTQVLEPDAVMYSPVIAYPKTELMKYCLQQNIVDADAWTRYSLGLGGLPYHVPEGMSLEEINRFCRLLSEKFYLSSKHIMKRIRGAKTTRELIDCAKAVGYKTLKSMKGEHIGEHNPPNNPKKKHNRGAQPNQQQPTTPKGTQ